MIKKFTELIITFLLIGLFISGCSVKSYIPEGEQFYSGVKEIKYQQKDGSNHGRLAIQDMENVLKYKPNNSIFGSASKRFPFTYPFYFSKKYAQSTNFLGRWLYKTFGDEPILISTVNPSLRATVAKEILNEYGYFESSVSAMVNYHSSDSVIASTSYSVVMGKPYLLDSISYMLHKLPLDVQEELQIPKERLLNKAQPFGVLFLENERTRISNELRGKGYYFFKPDNIVYEADTVLVPNKVQLRVKLSEKTPSEAFKPWKIGTITYNLYDAHRSELTDSVFFKGIQFKYHKKSPVRLRVLRPRVRIQADSLYSQEEQLQTLMSMTELNSFAYTDINYQVATQRDSINNLLHVTISSQLDRPYFSEFEGAWKWKSNNQTGPGTTFTVNRKNIFRGGELFNVQLHGSYEWETKRTSTDKSWNINSYELGLTTALTFPRLLLPGVYNRPPNYPVNSRISLYGTLLNRGRFYRLAKFGSDLTYKLEPNAFVRHMITPISISYNHLLHETDRFKEAVESNPVLGLSFQNQFVPQLNYLFRYERQKFMSRHGFSIEAYFAEAGGVMSLFYKGKTRPDGSPHKFLGAPFAQFLKGTLELRYNYLFSNKLQIASRAYAGVVWSYGNMLVAPYTEQFYVGGANSIRGFNVRSIGPGSYVPLRDDPLSFMDRTGDIRLEANVELRYKILGDLELASFVDAGNIWLMRDDTAIPDGTLDGNYFFKDVALSTGLGFRYNLMNYLVLRLDLGLALHEPSREQGRYFNSFGGGRPWPLAFHFAIGYPF